MRKEALQSILVLHAAKRTQEGEKERWTLFINRMEAHSGVIGGEL